MKNIKALTKSWITSYFVAPEAYVFIIIFLLLSGFFTFMISHFFEVGEASLNPFFMWHPWIYLFLVPAIGMRLWSDERKLGTIELLFTMPVTPLECIVSKFLAAWLFVIIALIMTFPIVITVTYLGNPDLMTIVTGYLGSALMAGCYLAIASFTSAMTRSQVVSFIISVVICLFLVLAGWPPVTDMLVSWAPRGLIDIVASCSVMPHFSIMQRGIVDSRDLLYFVSVIVLGLFMTGLVLKNHRAG